MTRVEIPTLFKFRENLSPNVGDVEVYRLYSLRRQIEFWCQANYALGSYHIIINRSHLGLYNDVEAKVVIDFKNDDDAIHFKLCYLEKE